MSTALGVMEDAFAFVALHQIEYGSTDLEYVASLADWLGVPEPNEENTTKPIKKEMMKGFERVMEDVNRQLFRQVGGL